jgi:hypothetical protein
MGFFDRFNNYLHEKIDYYIQNNYVNKIQKNEVKNTNTTEFGKKIDYDASILDYTSQSYLPFYKINKTYDTIVDLIKDYRRVSMFSYVNDALEEIINESIVLSVDETCKLKFKEQGDETKVPKKIKEILIEEFDNIKRLIDFDNEGDVLFRNWYIDGRIYIQQVLEKNNLKKGIVKLKQISPFEIKRVYDEKEQKHYYVYEPKEISSIKKNEMSKGNMVLKIPEELVAYCHSGVINYELNVPVSHLHYALRDINRLDVLEDHILIYRIVRAPERRAFYIDVGNLPQTKAEEYVKQIMNTYRNKKVFNATSGKIEDSIDQFAMLEDFFLIRRGGKGTEIDTISGGQGLDELNDLTYFERRVYKSLKVPQNRMKKEEAPSVDFSRQSEIERDELKFSKFIEKLRKRFSILWHILLQNQCFFKGLITKEEYDKYKPYIYFDYMTDNWWAEARDWEKLKSQLETLGDAEQYVGTWLSKEEVHKKIMKRTDDEIKILKNTLKKEAKEENSDDDPSDDEDFDFGKKEKK